MPQPKLRSSTQVEEGFRELAERLTPKYSEPEEAGVNLHLIERCLTKAFDIAYMAPYGSFGHGTHVAGWSPQNWFAVISKNKLYTRSGKSLHAILEVLRPHFPDASVITGRPVAAVPFGPLRSEWHHIVPAFPAGARDGHDLFCIPGPADRWITACPGAHSAWINALDLRFKRQLKPFIRMIKAWNFGEGEPIWSFYLEMAAADFLNTHGAGNYACDVERLFAYLLRRRLDPFSEAPSSSEPVYATSLADKLGALESLHRARDLAARARVHEHGGNVDDAFYCWRKLFNYQFPTR